MDDSERAELKEIYQREERWYSLFGLLNSELEELADEATEERISRLEEIVAVYEQHLLGDDLVVLHYCRKILAIDPRHPEAEHRAFEICEREGRLSDLLQLTTARAEAASDPAEKVALNHRVASLWIERMGDIGRAAAPLESILSTDPGDNEASRALEKVYRAQRRWKELLDLLECGAGAPGEARDLPLLVEMATIAEKRLEDLDRATPLWERVLALDPRHRGARDSLRTCYADAGNWSALEGLFEGTDDPEKLVSLLSTAAEKTTDPAARREIYSRCAEICAGHPPLGYKASLYYNRVLALDPSNEAAARAMVPIYRESLDWDNLFGVVSTLLSVSGELPVPTDDQEALAALEDIAAAGDHWTELHAISEALLVSERPPDQEWRRLNLQAAKLLGLRLGRASEALPRFAELFEHFPGDRSVVAAAAPLLDDGALSLEVARLLRPQLASTQSWQLEERVLTQLIDSSLSADECLDLQRQLASAYQHKRRSGKAALDVLASALREHPSEREVWDQLIDLGEETGRLEEIASLLGGIYSRSRLEAEDQLALAARLGEVLETRLEHHDEAEPYHLRVLEGDPRNQYALSSLEHTYFGDERWDELLELYDRTLAADLNRDERIELSLKVCVLTDEVLNWPAQAIDRYRGVLELDPGNQRAVRSLKVLYEDEERWADLADLLAGELAGVEPGGQTSTRYRLAEIMERHLENPAAALERYGEVLAADPTHGEARRGLERLIDRKDLRQAAAALLARVYKHHGEIDPLARVLDLQLKGGALAKEEAVAVGLEVAGLREQQLGDPFGAFESLSRALVAAPGDERITSEMIRLARGADMPELYAQVLDEALARAQSIGGVTPRLLFAAAHLLDEQLGDASRAERTYRRLLDINPSNEAITPVAAAALDRLLTARGASEELLGVLDIRISFAQDAAARVGLLHRVAALEENELGDPDRAIATLEKVLSLDEGNVAALEGMERLLEKAGRWLELMDLLRKRSSAETDPDKRQALFRRVSELASQLRRR